MDSVRLRRIFRYPEEEGVASNEGLDEQEQEEVIEKIIADDTKSTASFKKFFVTLPAVTTLYYVAESYMNSKVMVSSWSNIIIWILSLISLATSFLIAFDIPTTEDEDKFSTGYELLSNNLQVADRKNIFHMFLRWNLGASLPATFSIIPAIAVYIFTTIARRELRPVNVQELEKMKYNYKGA